MPTEVINKKTNPVHTSFLRCVGVPREISVSGTSASIALTSSSEAISITAVGCAVAFRIGVGAQTAVVTDHYIADGERLDLAVEKMSIIGAIAADGTSSGALKISELV